MARAADRASGLLPGKGLGLVALAHRPWSLPHRLPRARENSPSRSVTVPAASGLHSRHPYAGVRETIAVVRRRVDGEIRLVVFRFGPGPTWFLAAATASQGAVLEPG